MKAIGFYEPLPIENEASLLDIELPMPDLQPKDLLVEVMALSVNPADGKVRSSFRPSSGACRILGWDAAGIVRQVGCDVVGFKPGDEVFYAGAINRQGCYAQYQCVDERIVAKKPQKLGFEQAAALPLTSLTAWETLFDRLDVTRRSQGGEHSILVIGAAGGVGSQTVQLIKALTGLSVIATASRAESKQWVKSLGADYILDHTFPLKAQLDALTINAPTFVFITTQSEVYLPQVAELIAPQGHIALIDDPKQLNVLPLKSKSVSLHWEFMFTRSMFQTTDMSRQAFILESIAKLIDEEKIKTTMTQSLGHINAANLRAAHALIESNRTIGKIVLAGW